MRDEGAQQQSECTDEQSGLDPCRRTNDRHPFAAARLRADKAKNTLQHCNHRAEDKNELAELR